MEKEERIANRIAEELNIKLTQVQKTIELIDSRKHNSVYSTL